MLSLPLFGVRGQACCSCSASKPASSASIAGALSGTPARRRSGRSGLLARRGVDAGQPGALGFQRGDQRRVRRGVQQDAAQLHAHHRRDGADLDVVGRAAFAEQRQHRLGEPPGHDRVARRVGDLCEGKMLRAPVGGLQGLVQRKAEIAGGRGLQGGRVRTVEQAHGLQGAVDADGLDAALGEIAEVERRVVHDDRPLPDRREHGPVDLVQVDHGDAGAAAVERAEPRRRTVRIETGPLGVVLGALQRGKLRLGDRERGRRLRRDRLPLVAPRRGARRRPGPSPSPRLPGAEIRTALPLARQRGGLEVDGDEAFPRIGDDRGDEGGRRRRVGGVGRPHLEVRTARSVGDI